jgi:hypothetical protein
MVPWCCAVLLTLTSVCVLQLLLVAKVARTQTNCSAETTLAVCKPFDESVLGDAQQLVHALQSPLLCKIPVNRYVADDSGLTYDTVFARNAEEEATDFVNQFSAFETRCAALRAGMSEESVLACITTITGLMWNILLASLPVKQVFMVQYNKKDMAGSTLGDGRPDETDYLDDFMVSKSEHKDENVKINPAVAELTDKLSGYNHVEYGLKIVFLPVIAAAGTIVEFGLVDVRTKAYHQVNRYNSIKTGDRVLCFVRSVNMLRLIRTMAPHVPTNPTPLFKQKNHIAYSPAHVTKILDDNCTCPEELYDLLKKGAIPHAVTVEKSRSGRSVKVSPLGVRTPDNGEGLVLEDVRSAVRAVLQCLEVLHDKKFVHRDLRWANVIRLFTCHVDGSPANCEFLVIDFEFAAVEGEEVQIARYIHSDIAPYGTEYTSHHDLKLVGKLVHTWASKNRNVVLDESAKDFIASVQREADPLNAKSALQHHWLSAP